MAPSQARIWAALGAVYLIWGSTYLAIRVAVQTLPPFLMASTRFLLAGGVLYLIAIRRGDRRGDRPTAAGWRAAAIVGGALLLGGNGGVVWAEQRVPSGLAALFVAPLPIWMAVLARIFHGERIAARTLVGLALGFGGLVLLVGRVETGGVDPLGAVVLMTAAFSWAAGSLYARTAPLPKRPLVGTAMEMLAGGSWLLAASIVAGEPARFDVHAVSAASVTACVYLVVAGSLVAFSCYVWLLGHAPLPLVSTYAYVNPVIAVLLGWLVLSEPVTPRVLVAGAAIVAAVALIASRREPAAEVRADLSQSSETA